MLDLLEDFLVVARQLNITRAARELNMTQSNLSRRIAQLEKELGFKLFLRKENRISLTNAGRAFADELAPILTTLESLKTRCQQISRDEPFEIKIQDPPYQDASVPSYIQLLDDVKKRHPFAVERYILPSRILPKECLKQGTLDIALLHVHESVGKTLDELQEEGFSARHLGTVPLGAWMERKHISSNKKLLEFEDLCHCRILTPNDVYSPIRDTLKALFENRGVKPLFVTVNTKSQTEFMRHRDPNCVFVFPQTMRNDFRIASRSDLQFVPIANDVYSEVIAIARKEDELF